MGREISIIYLSRWSELEEEAAKTPLCDIDIYRFRAPGTGQWSLGPKAELTFESLRWHDVFRRQCDDVAALCPPELDQQLMTLFNWVDEVEEFDAPFSRTLRCPDSSPWKQIEEGLMGAFNPQTVAHWCEVARSFSWEECEPFFVAKFGTDGNESETQLSFKHLRAHGQSWIEHYNEACELNAGLVVYHWG